MGRLDGFGIAPRIEQLSEDVLELNEGTVYTSLLRLQQQGWIASKWGTSENNRKARFYSITKIGTKQLALETENCERFAGVIGRVLRRGLLVTLIGLCIGLAAAIAAARLLAPLLYGIGANDPATLAGVAVGVTTVAMLACYLPARRAMRVDPAVALRYE